MRVLFKLVAMVIEEVVDLRFREAVRFAAAYPCHDEGCFVGGVSVNPALSVIGECRRMV